MYTLGEAVVSSLRITLIDTFDEAVIGSIYQKDLFKGFGTLYTWLWASIKLSKIYSVDQVLLYTLRFTSVINNATVF